MHYLFATTLSPTQEIRSSFVSTTLFRKYAVKGNTSSVLSSLPLSAPFHFCRAQNCARQVPLTFFSWALPLSVAATLPPQTPLRSAKAVLFIGVSPLLVVMLACGSLRADRAVTIFAGFCPVLRRCFSVVRKLPPFIQPLTTPHARVAHSLHTISPSHKSNQ